HAGDWKATYERLGVIPASTPRQGGTEWHDCRSPLRPDRTPSFSFSDSHGGWKDFGSDETGDAVALVARALKVSEEEAVDRLIAGAVGNTAAAPPGPATPGVTLANYAAAKRFDPAWLAREFGLADATYAGAPAVAMPYIA